MNRGRGFYRTWLATVGLAAAGGMALWLLRPSAEPLAGTRFSASFGRPADTHRIKSAGVPVERTLLATNAQGAPLVPVEPPVEQAIALAGLLSFDERFAILRLQKSALTPEQAARLAAFVREVPISPQTSSAATSAEFSPEEQRALKNEVLNLLARQPGSRDQLAALLRAVHENPRQDPAMRDYALQFLAVLMRDDQRLPADYALHWRAVEGSDPYLAATALLHLMDASREKSFPAAQRRKLADAAFQIAADPQAPPTSRSTALQVCGQLGDDRARPIAYALARSERESFPLRIAAVAALGDLTGEDPAIRQYLRQLVSGPEQRLRVPAASALQRLNRPKS